MHTSNESMLRQIYNSDSFGEKAQATLAMLTRYLNTHLEGKGTTVEYASPQDMLNYWRDYTEVGSLQLLEDFIEKSIHIHNPRYMGHQVVPPAPDTVIADMVGTLLNNGGAVYEMGMASNALEKVVIERLLPYFGFSPEQGGGIFTSGGTLANLTACLCARSNKCKEVWQYGAQERYAFMVSSEAHYCIDRAVRIMGWGDEGMVKVPVDDQFRMRVDLLSDIYKDATSKDIKIIGIVGSAPSTSTGNYDDLKSIGQFAKEKDLWFHIDAAHGGPAVFSKKYKHLMNGCEVADSITVDGHKMMMMPGITTKLLFREEKASYRTFAQEASYLWEDASGDWHNAGKRTFECTKLIMSLRYFIIMQSYGIEGFEAFVDQCYDNGQLFHQLADQHHYFETAAISDSNIVCFRPKHATTSDQITKIRQAILQQGKYYIVQTSLQGSSYLRVSLMNPFTNTQHMSDMLEKVLEISYA